MKKLWIEVKPFVLGLVIGTGLMAVAVGASYLANGHV